ncbi:MAG: L-serine ammonia-lyase, iron-sulfur-dependent, subunit alpha [Bacilli bacterium]|nr:L-serine ammonia-lyase, iron-sulfur-dependent, subunit alpha [Bacilli bacterium]
MNSVQSLFKIGPGPSSSHTIGPYRAAQSFLTYLVKNKIAFSRIVVYLYGSLAHTGEGHKTNAIVSSVLADVSHEVIIDKTTNPEHPNTMEAVAYLGETEVIRIVYRSIGGGDVESDIDEAVNVNDVYPFHTFTEMADYMLDHRIKSIPELVMKFEGKPLMAYLDKVIDTMTETVAQGIAKEGTVVHSKSLHVQRRAKELYTDALRTRSPEEKSTLLLSAYAVAAGEENATGGMVVTAPTCGSAGVISSLVANEARRFGYSRDKLRKALMTAGMIGNIIKENATVAGAVGGCQAEIGSASAMGAALLCQLKDAPLNVIEYAAAHALSDFLGLTCDPVGGYVIFPCIERNATAVIHAQSAAIYARSLGNSFAPDMTFDGVVRVMKETGDAMSPELKETSLGGMAKHFKDYC